LEFDVSELPSVFIPDFGEGIWQPKVSEDELGRFPLEITSENGGIKRSKADAY
jgi:hypothetical protein